MRNTTSRFQDTLSIMLKAIFIEVVEVSPFAHISLRMLPQEVIFWSGSSLNCLVTSSKYPLYLEKVLRQIVHPHNGISLKTLVINIPLLLLVVQHDFRLAIILLDLAIIV